MILLAAAALRIAHLREIAAHDPFFALHDVDSALYDAWARRILAGLAPDDGVLFLGPLYAYFMALVYAIGGATPAAVKAVQCALGVASVALVGLLARECFDRRTALVAAAIAAGYEMLIFYSGTLLVVNIQVPLVLLLVWLSVRALRDPTPVRWLIVDAGAITSVDYSAARVLRALVDDLSRGGVVVLLVHAEASLLSDLRRHRLTDVAAPGRAFNTLREALAVIRGAKGKDSV